MVNKRKIILLLYSQALFKKIYEDAEAFFSIFINEKSDEGGFLKNLIQLYNFV